ncbi:MAG: phosphoglucosamine mutase [Candidatus Zixiibacteriota bacterium]|nr:MAG: phosphoglucosamine mutase [candidate division Zixibacteria bacterium]
MKELMISVSGIRGIIGKAFTAETALNYARAFGAFLKEGRVAVGRDTRKTGPMVTSAVISGLLASGCDVVDLGICPTPTIEMAVRDAGFNGGVAVTASHNPMEYNALKLLGEGGVFLSDAQGKKVQRLFNSGRFKDCNWSSIGKATFEDKWIDHHIKKITELDIISPPSIRKRRLKVVADCGGGAACYMAGRFFKKLGVEYKLIHFVPTGEFPRGPEPVPENLVDLSRAVKRSRADVGFAFDPDADRLAIVSEKGEPIGEEYTLALGSRYILSRKIGPMAVNLSSSLLNDFVAREAGVKLHRTKVGERNVTEKLRRVGGVVGGEGNGGLIYPQLHWGRDAFLAAAVITQYLVSSGSKISELVLELPRYFMIKTMLELAPSEVERKKNAIEIVFKGDRINRADGLKISGKDWWVQIRASNTEPIARIISEARDYKTARNLIAKVRSVFMK